MPKHDFLSAKAISNRQKSVGLQKLRWYCQMCQKQCRDENGFKCHTASEGHLRQMRVFAENPNSFLDEFSKEFERGYLQTLSHRHGTKRVKANVVYQEYIADKQHIHMNATIWTTLTTFIKYLGKEGKVEPEETEKGWFITFIDRDPKALARQQQSQQRQKEELDEEDRKKRVIAAQIKAAEEKLQREGKEGNSPVDHNYNRDDDGEKVQVSLKTVEEKKKTISRPAVFSMEDDDEEEGGAEEKGDFGKNGSGEGGMVGKKRGNGLRTGRVAALDDLMREEEERKYKRHKTGFSSAPAVRSERNDDQYIHDKGDKDKSNKDSEWLARGIIVRVLDKNIDRGKWYQQKGEVVEVRGKKGLIAFDRDEVWVDQRDIETVIPKVGQEVRVLKGSYRKCKGILLGINQDDFCCDVRISYENDRGEKKEKVLTGLEFEDISKYAKS